MLQSPLKRTFCLFIGLIAAGVFCGASAQTTATKNKLAYQDYLQSIINNLPELQANGVNLLTQENALKKAQSMSDISLTANGSYSLSDQLVQNAGPGEYTNAEIKAGVAKKFTQTGTIVGLNGGYSDQGYSGFAPQVDGHTYSPFIGVSVKQPLLKNFLGKVDRYTEQDASMKVDVEKIRLIELNKNSLNAYKKLYFEWILTIKKVQNSRASITNSQTQLNQVRRNYQSGVNEEDDYQRSLAALIDYQQQLENNLIILRNIEAYLSIYVDVASLQPIEADFDEYFNASNNGSFGFVEFSDTNYAKMLTMTMDRLLYSKGVFENRTLPDLNVMGAYSRKNLTTDSSKKFSSFSEKDWQIGFEFVYSLENNMSEAELKDVEIQVQSLEYERQIAINNYKKSLSGIMTSVEGTKELLKKKNEYLTALTRQLAAERRKYQQGRLNLSYVIATENLISSTRTAIFTLRYQLIANHIDYTDITQ